VQTLTNAGYNVLLDEEQLSTAQGDKVVGLFADRAMNKILEGRGDYLANATAKAALPISCSAVATPARQPSTMAALDAP
jgi:alkaline phosphatase